MADGRRYKSPMEDQLEQPFWSRVDHYSRHADVEARVRKSSSCYQKRGGSYGALYDAILCVSFL